MTSSTLRDGIRFIAALAAIVSTSTAAFAQSTMGVAYDSVTKLVATSDPPLRPADFAADFRAGQAPNSTCTPSLIRRYMTVHKERIDDVCRQDATIVDCKTRTATLLDLATKTDAIVSLDAGYDDGIADASALSAEAEMTSQLLIRRADLGPKNVEDALTDERTESQERTSVSGVLSMTTRDRWTYDFMPTPLPELACLDAAAPWLSRYGRPQRYEPELARFFEMWRTKNRSSRSTVSESGPSLPSWRIVLYAVGEHFQRQAGAPDSTYFFEEESGNIRSIDDNDPVFTLPADFRTMPSLSGARSRRPA